MYINHLEESIRNKETRIRDRKAQQEYPEHHDFALEAELTYEIDLLQQAKHLHEISPEAFKPTLKITHENFQLKQQIKTLTGQLQRALVGHDQQLLSSGQERKERGTLIIEN